MHSATQHINMQINGVKEMECDDDDDDDDDVGYYN